MTLRGYVKDGVVVPYEPSLLEEGAEVDIQPSGKRSMRSSSRQKPAPNKGAGKAKTGSGARPSKESKKKSGRKAKPLALREILDKFAGKFTGLPSDLARNHDHYLHGKPKKP